ncbi:TPA: ComF family protein [Streptococcus suis]
MSNCLLCDQAMKIKTRFSDLIFFSKAQSGVCSDCFSTFEEIAEQHCPCCSKSGESTICQDCQYWQKQGKKVSHTALFKYNDEMANYFSRYKFQGDYLLRKVFAKELILYFKQWEGYTIVPIPLGQRRLEERGFNQVTALLDEAGLPYRSLLGKEDVDKQSAKSRTERLKIRQPFYLIAETPLPENILLVDDIYTTGVTIQLAKETLMKNGAKTVKSFSIAR